jgi:multidrug efflux pump subunit AcrB
MTEREKIAVVILVCIWFFLTVLTYNIIGGWAIPLSIICGVSMIAGWRNEGQKIEQRKKNGGDM